MAFVVQRYGEGITGGSESLARAVAERLASDYRITVFTSCARDYVTWRNELPRGSSAWAASTSGDFRLAQSGTSRHSTRSRNRSTDSRKPDRQEVQTHGAEGRGYGQSFGAGASGGLAPKSGSSSAFRGRRCLGSSSALRAERDRFAAFVFFTYLYYPTYWGLAAVPERAVLVPTTHDEPPLRFSIYREVFAAPRAFGFLTPAEEALVRRRFDVGGRPVVLTGMGVDVPAAPDVPAFRARHGIGRPYAIYAGRIDAGKGCAEMLAHHERYRQQKQDAARPGPDRPARDGGAAAGGRAIPGLPARSRRRPRRSPVPTRSCVRAPSRACRSPAGGLRARDARPRQRPLGSAEGALPALGGVALLRGRRRVRRGPGPAWRATPRFERRSVRAAAATWRPSTAGTWSSTAGVR